MEQFQKDSLTVKKCVSHDELGKTSADDVTEVVLKLLKKKATISMIFAAAPSQDDFLQRFSENKEIDFLRINAFHMDEYIGLDHNAPQEFGNYLKEHIFGKCPFKSVHYLNGQNAYPQEECKRYASLLEQYTIDIVCMGIGENGHIAFNDPMNADFHDPLAVKVVNLDEICRQQQVNEGCFQNLDLVPKTAMTLTIPTLMNADYHFCIVPSSRKAQAVYDTINGEISAKCPGSILRAAPHAILYLDEQSASKI
jgi:glucosamine-6-phosphate deaminase